MIHTTLTLDTAKKLLEMGHRLHEESQFSGEPYDDVKVMELFESTLTHPSRRFVAFDSEFRGFILMGINEHFFNHVKKAADFCLYIVPEHRGGSLVVRLINEACSWAKSNGAEDITIHHNTGINMESAPKLFNKLGFNTAGYIFTKELGNVRNS